MGLTSQFHCRCITGLLAGNFAAFLSFQKLLLPLLLNLLLLIDLFLAVQQAATGKSNTTCRNLLLEVNLAVFGGGRFECLDVALDWLCRKELLLVLLLLLGQI